jgi:gas vesicle protein
MKIHTTLQPAVAVAALIIAPKRVLRGCSKKSYRQLVELEELVRESEARREAVRLTAPIRVVSTRV